MLSEGTNIIENERLLLDDDIKLNIRCYCINNPIEKLLADYHNNYDTWKNEIPEEIILDIAVKYIMENNILLNKEYIIEVTKELLKSWSREKEIARTIIFIKNIRRNVKSENSFDEKFTIKHFLQDIGKKLYSILN